MSGFGQIARLSVLGVGIWASLASAGNQQQVATAPAAAPSSPGEQAPPAREMNADMAVGLWHSSWGPVKMELQPGASEEAGAAASVAGVWVYDRSGEEVIGSFAGELRGNVLQFEWEEPGTPQPLTGAGYLVFEPNGVGFRGRWWTADGSRSGEWNGWRQDPYLGRATGTGATGTGPDGGTVQPDGTIIDGPVGDPQPDPNDGVLGEDDFPCASDGTPPKSL